MPSDKVTKFPLPHSQRIKNKYGKHAALCEITGRWLNFDKVAHVGFDGKEWFFVDVMTQPEDNIPENAKKITQLYLSREDLERVLNNIESPK